MAITRFDRIVWAVLALLMLTIAAVLLAGDRVGVRVELLYLDTGSPIAATAPLALRFDQAIEADSLSPRLSIEPETDLALTWQDQTLVIRPRSPWQPDQSYTFTIQAGVESHLGHSLSEDFEYRFRVRPPGVAYLLETETGRELWALLLIEGEPVRLSGGGQSVFDFGVAPDGERIAYSVVNEEGGLDLWLVDRFGEEPRLLLKCGLDRCSGPAWSPDGTRVAYHRAPAGLDVETPYGPLRVWLLDVFTGDTLRLHADTQKLGYSPAWSPDGERLAYFDGVKGRIVVVDMDSGDETYLPSAAGEVGAWSPDGQHMLYYDIQSVEGQTQNVIYRADFANQDVLPLFDPLPRDASYSSPAWSPDGAWVAFRVRPLEGGPGDQVWITPADGAYALVISAEEGHIHSDIHWDAWSGQLLFKRIPLGVSFPDQEVWIWSQADGNLQQVVPDASLPVWLP